VESLKLERTTEETTKRLVFKTCVSSLRENAFIEKKRYRKCIAMSKYMRNKFDSLNKTAKRRELLKAIWKEMRMLPYKKSLATLLFEKKQRSSIIAIEILTKELHKNYKKKMLS
jgi:hypothetical protein